MFRGGLDSHPVLLAVMRSSRAYLVQSEDTASQAILLLKGVYKRFSRASDEWNTLSGDVTYLQSKYEGLKTLDNPVHLELWEIEVDTKKRLCDLVFAYLLQVTDLMQAMVTQLQGDGVLDTDFDLDSFMEETH